MRSRFSMYSFWARHSGLLALLVFALVTALGFGLDVLLFQEGIPRKELMLASDLITGIVAGWLFYRFLRNERSKQESVQQSIRTIADLNHHIRNALQIIRHAGGTKSTSDATQLQLINEAVARIDWALRELLPKYSPGATVANGDRKPNESATPSFSATVVDDFVLRHKQTRTL